ncbi:MAG: four-carbon acid sugar kinase family protein [Desulfococcaceae bacterium]
MLEAAVIADDLTGAGDTGVQFIRSAAPIYLAALTDLDRAAFRIPPAGLSVHTDSRALPASEAADKVRTAAKKLAPFKPRFIYKKVDSCLRGNIGAEADAILDQLDLPVGFLVPGFPGQGRTTVHDVHQIHGRPVAETEMARDPVTPVTESRLSVLMAGQSRYPVGSVDIDDYHRGPGHLAKRVFQLIADGCRHVAFDVQTPEHLDAIAHLVQTRFPKALMIGSAGLAEAFSALTAGGKDRTPELTRPAGPGILVVAGSASQITRDQLDGMIQTYSPNVVTLVSDVLADPDQWEQRRMIARRAGEQLADGMLVWRLSSPPAKKTHPPLSILKGVSDLIRRLLAVRVPDGLVLTGGDTARAVLRASGAFGFELQREILPGLVWGAAAGGRLDGRTIVTKAGAFGRPDAFTRLYPILLPKKET